LEKYIFLDEEEKDGYWGLDFDGMHSSPGSSVGIV